jgi:peptide/nickel transport system substrate-binding protein
MTGISRRGLFAASALLGGAGAPLMTVAEAHAQGVAPRRGGTLTSLLTPEPPVLVLGVNNQGPTLLAASKIYQGLVRFSPTLEPLPELARSWTLSDDRRTYTFNLQPGVKFHDGRDMTAEDVVFSVMKFHMELAPRARGIFQRITEAKVVDPTTVQFTLNAPFEPFLLMFDVTACAIVPKHIYDGTDYRTNPANARPIGTGPFAFAEWQRGNFIRLRRFEQYWKPNAPLLDELIFRVVPDSQSRRLAMQTGQAQLAAANDLEPFDLPQFEQAQNVRVVKTGWEYFSPLAWIEVNHRVTPLGDPRFRRAIAHAVDRNFIASRLWFGAAKPATSPIASGTRFHDPAARLPEFNPRTAAGFLDAMGLRPNAQGVRASLKMITLPYGEIWTRLAEYVRQSLRQVGIEITLETTDAGGWVQRVAQWDYELTFNFLYQFGDPTLGVARTYVSNNIQRITFTNTGGYRNEEVDRLFAAAQDEGDPARRADLFKQVQAKLIGDMPQIWLAELLFPTVHDRRLTLPSWGGTGIHASLDDVFFAG